MARTKVKERKVFSLSNFRGLDKENKPLKVASFRASDGENFIIDSGTLRTRPGFLYYDTPFKHFNVDVEIIDFYSYGEIMVYVTNRGFYFVYNGEILSGSTSVTVVSNVMDVFVNGLRPIFQEEKKSLFVFGMGDVFVISKLYYEDGSLQTVVLYKLNKKPFNPFLVGKFLYSEFEDLPIPYEPTLFIGDKRLDDVNLLSNVYKYKFFANNEEGINTYILPTHYDNKKHGEPSYKVEFYKDMFSKLKTFPVFLGKENEDFNNVNSYGDVLNIGNPIEIQDEFEVREHFEYFVGTPPTPIKEVLGLKKEVFYSYRIKTTGQNLYEYLLNYITLNDISDNKVLVFVMPYTVVSDYKDSDGLLQETKKEKKTELIYIQLKNVSYNEKKFVNKQVGSGEEINVNPLSSNWPNAPLSQYEEDVLIDLTPINAIEKNNFSQSNFLSFANTWLEQNKDNVNFVNNAKVKLTGRYFENIEVNEKLEGNVNPYYTEWEFSGEPQYVNNFIDKNGFPDYPSFSNPEGLTVIELDDIITTSGESIDYSNLIERINVALTQKLNDEKNDLNLNKKYGFVKFMVGSYYGDGRGTFYDIGVSIVAEFSYTFVVGTTYQRRNTYAMTFDVEVSGELENDLYEISFDDEQKSFVLKVKDYFYNYNNEPAIDVKVTFEKNPDYKLIANSKIGINFGSENRLFLAGNKDYPNIDRYNVSNDLLGDNIKNQSYELSYFPTLNRRVIGGRGAINGYVIANDTQLYVTKEDYPNDNKLYIRNRILDDNGIVGYNEFKTNIDKTSLNNRTLVRFYNDIVFLDKSGLYGLEITSNVLTNERLIKSRGSFINKEIEKTIKNYDKNKIFIYEDNEYMYVFIGKKIFVADSRYVDVNPNGEVGNMSYEIVEWNTHVEFKQAKKINDKIVLLDEKGENLYFLSEERIDEEANYEESSLVFHNREIANGTLPRGLYYKIDEIINDIENVSFIIKNKSEGFKEVFRKIAEMKDFTYEHIDNNLYKFNINDSFRFRSLVDDDKVFFIENKNTMKSYKIFGLSESERESFYIDDFDINIMGDIYVDATKMELFPKTIYKDGNGYNLLILSPYKQEKVIEVVKNDSETQKDYEERVLSLEDDYNNYIRRPYDGSFYFQNDVVVKIRKPIKLRWISNVNNLGSNLVEKTLFRTNIYASKQEKGNEIKYGFKTMRGGARLEDYKIIQSPNPFNFEEADFALFSISSFDEMGYSIPTKENNFLYIQVAIYGVGDIELNQIEMIFKNNRMLKTIG